MILAALVRVLTLATVGAGVACGSILANPQTPAVQSAASAAIDRATRPLEAWSRTHAPDAIYANFAGDGAHYIRYRSERALARALAAFLAGPAPGGGNFVARTYRMPGSPALMVRFDPGVQNSLTERERAFYDATGRLVRVHDQVTSYNGYYRLVRNRYFGLGGVVLADRTMRYDYAPNDDAFAHPLKVSQSTFDVTTLPLYGTRATLPFPA